MGIEVIVFNLILAIPTFFFCRLIFKGIKKEGLRQLTTWITTIVLTPLVYVGLVLIFIAYVSYYPERDFDKEKWKTDVEKRYQMTDDLVDNRKLIGKTKDEIKDLLGQESVSLDSLNWTYYIGYRPGVIVIDPDVLEIEFKDNKVVKCWTRRT